jgi:hypothetical protein
MYSNPGTLKFLSLIKALKYHISLQSCGSEHKLLQTYMAILNGRVIAHQQKNMISPICWLMGL